MAAIFQTQKKHLFEIKNQEIHYTGNKKMSLVDEKHIALVKMTYQWYLEEQGSNLLHMFAADRDNALVKGYAREIDAYVTTLNHIDAFWIFPVA